MPGPASAIPGRLAALRTAAIAALAMVLSVVLPAGCASLASFSHPPALSEERALVVAPTGARGPSAEVEIVVDERGVPHIYGGSEADLAYGLGFMHARDRLFQLLVLRHASQGRLTELFGASLVEADRQLRLLSFGVEAQVEAMSPRDRRIAEAYAAGVNEGALHAGRSLEMQVLGTGFAPWTVADVVRIMRLEAWDLSTNLRSELARARILARLPAGDPRRDALLGDVPSGGVPIVRPEDQAPPAPFAPHPDELDGAPDDDAPPAVATPAPAPAPTQDTEGAESTEDAQATLARLLASLGYEGPLTGRGLSNSWVVHGARTTSGRPVLVNDPHLGHNAPSVFYLAHLEHPDFTLAGATFPGLPAVVIGHTRHLAWGLTTSYADTQDLVALDVDPARETHYVVDGEAIPFGLSVQRYLANGEVVLTETWRTSVFGPVLPPGFSNLTEPSATYAVLWPGFDAEASREQLSAFFDLGRARTIDEVERVLEQIPAPSQNVVLAFTDGTIAYRLMGAIPRRESAAPIDRPRDGRRRDAGWTGYLTPEEKPRVDNPASGYLVAANQRIVERDGPGAFSLGKDAAPPYRALRIHERLGQLLDKGAASPEALLDIQQDIVSVEARKLAPVLGAHCPSSLPDRDPALVEAFCAAVRGFDGAYTKDSLGALPYTRLLATLYEEILAVHVGDDVARQLVREPFVTMALERALLDESEGHEKNPLLDDLRTRAREGLPGFVRRAADETLALLVERRGRDPTRWRWGAAHTLAFDNPLAQTPFIGGLFHTRPLEQSGWSHAPRAEGPLPVRSGAALRFLAELSEPIQSRAVLDLGQSGHIGHPHATDQLPLWDAGKPFPFALTRDDVEARAEGRLLLLPRAHDENTP